MMSPKASSRGTSSEQTGLFDDGLWHAENYDDEPRSSGNFGLDPCMQMMEVEVEIRKREALRREMDLTWQVMCERRGARHKLAEGSDARD